MGIVYLVRHAETEKMAGINECSDALSPRGKKQAIALAQRFKHIPLDAVYSSELHRAHETAMNVITYHPGITCTVSKKLNEVDSTIVGGKKKHVTPGRPGKDIIRADSVFKRFFKCGNKRTLIVCHGNLIRYLIAKAFGENPKTFFSKGAWIPTFPTSITIFRIKDSRDNKITVFTLNDISHLSKSLRNGQDFPGFNFP